MSKANNSLLMKEQNRCHILRLIRSSPMSRADIARNTGLTRAAVTIIVDKLLEEKLIIEGEAIKSSSGRHPTLLHLNNEACYAYGIDITRDGCNLSLCDFSGKIIQKDFVEFGASPQKTVQAIKENFRQYDKNIIGIGISAPGPIDSTKGVILDPPELDHFKNFNIKEVIEADLQLPVFFEKDTNALALYEKNVSHKDNFLYLLADHGLGGAFIKDGALFKGYNGLGCEIGHISLDINGEKCSCGNIGCASLYVSTKRIRKKAEKASYKEVCICAKKGEKKSLDALNYQAEMLSHALITFVNLFEPEEIILGGELKYASEILKPIIEESLKKYTLTRSMHTVTVEGSLIEDRAASPACMVLESFFMKG